MPCQNAAAAKDRAEFIKNNCKDVNAFAGLTDPVEMIKIIHKPRRHDPLVNWIPCAIPTEVLYSQLLPADVERLIDGIVSLVGSNQNDMAMDIASCLAAFTDSNLERVLDSMIDQNSFYPALVFRNASEKIRNRLVEKGRGFSTDNAKTLGLNHYLLALAWAGGDQAVQLFQEWRKNPPIWRGLLHVPPEAYAKSAGWELAENGQRRDLIFHECWKLERGESGSNDGFVVISPREDSCPWCHATLTNLITFNPRAWKLEGLEAASDRIQVPTCEICTAFGTIFGRFGESGSGWSGHNRKPNYLPPDPSAFDRLPENRLHPTQPRGYLHAAEWTLPTTYSQLGGHPSWVQDAEYPPCPECAKSMKFIAQISHDEIVERTEGLYYAFVCPDCRTTATSYQQT